MLLESDPSVAKNELIFPSDAVLARARTFRGFTAEEDKELSPVFEKLVT